jgi:hypothetical protein
MPPCRAALRSELGGCFGWKADISQLPPLRLISRFRLRKLRLTLAPSGSPVPAMGRSGLRPDGRRMAGLGFAAVRERS